MKDKRTRKCAECAASIVRWTTRTDTYFCGFDCKAAYQRRAKPVSREWLVQKYVTEGLDCSEIAKIVKRDPKSVWNWMKDFGIPTRKRGAASGHGFKKGATSKFKGHHHTEEWKLKASEHAKATGRVPYKPEVGSYMKGRRGAAHPNWKGGVTPERQAFYSTDEWRDAVKIVWKRANAKCERCGISHNTKETRGTFHVHHIVSFAYRPLRAEPSNLALLCRGCHLFIHSNANTTKDFIGTQP